MNKTNENKDKALEAMDAQDIKEYKEILLEQEACKKELEELESHLWDLFYNTKQSLEEDLQECNDELEEGEPKVESLEEEIDTLQDRMDSLKTNALTKLLNQVQG